MRRAALLAVVGTLASAPAAADAPPSKTLERALALYDKKDFFSATIELEKVLVHDSGDDGAGEPRAELYMAKALYQMRFYAASLAFLQNIVHTDGHPYRVTALEWLAALAPVVGDDHVAELVASYDPQALDDPTVAAVSATLHYLSGIGKLAHGDAAGAVGELASVPAADHDHDRALVALGFALARLHADDKAMAVWATVGAGDAGDLAALATGEQQLRAGAWEQTRAAFARVSPTGGLAARAAWEASWAELRARGVAPAVDNLFAPATTELAGRPPMDVPWLLALEVCGAPRATLDVLAAFRGDHLALHRTLGELLDRYGDDEMFERVVVPVRAGTARLGTQRLHDYLRTLFGSPPMAAVMAWDDELTGELAQLNAADKAWQTTQIAAEILQQLVVEKSVADADAGKRARDRIAAARDALAALLHLTVTLPAGRNGAGDGLAVTCAK